MIKHISRTITIFILMMLLTTVFCTVAGDQLSDGSAPVTGPDGPVSTEDLDKEMVNDNAMLAALGRHESREIVLDDYIIVKKAKLYNYSFYALHPDVCLYYTPNFIMKSYNKDSDICIGYDVNYISKESGDTRIKELENVTESIVSEANRYSNKDKVFYVVRWIKENCDYTDKIFDIWGTCSYGCLVKGKATCLGYSEAMLYLMDRLDVPCKMVINKTHAWNEVRMDGKWQKVDLTKNDPLS